MIKLSLNSRVKFPEPAEDTSDEVPANSNDSHRATPFRFELKGPHPSSFKRPKYPQLSQYRHPHASRNIQDIIKYLTNDPETLNRGIKFTGFYVNPKKYDTSQMDIGEVALNSDRSEEQENAPYAIALNGDPLYQYKPKHPADVNLLATSNFRYNFSLSTAEYNRWDSKAFIKNVYFNADRFSPMGMQRYNPYYDSYYQRPNSNKHSVYQENQYDSAGSYGTSHGKKRRPKPFSVMLDIYPITDTVEQTKKSSRLKPPTVIEDSDMRRLPIPYYARYPKLYGMQPQSPPGPMPVQSHHQAPEEEEKHQMILHLNLYPKRKSKMTR